MKLLLMLALLAVPILQAAPAPVIFDSEMDSDVVTSPRSRSSM